MFSLKKIFKIFFYLLILGVFFLFVDLDNLSLKTVVPKKVMQTQLVESIDSGVVRNLNRENSERNFDGNEQDIIDFVNKARIEADLETLEPNEKLTLSAMDKAEHMRDNNYFDHVSPEGLNPWYFAQKRNYNYKTFGENLAEGYFSAESVHHGWMNSEGHRKNILSSDFKEIGVAILEFEQDGQKSYLAVQHFGSKLTSEDLTTEIVCTEKSKENCEDIENEEDRIENLVDEQEKIIKEAKKAGAGQKDLNRLEENLEDLKNAKKELGDYLDECEEFLDKCDRFE